MYKSLEIYLIDEDLPEVLNLFGAILEHDDRKLVHERESDVGEYRHFSTMLLNFAYQSRVDSGYRLLDRCARHACDPKTTSLYNESASLFKDKNGKFLVKIKVVLFYFWHFT